MNVSLAQWKPKTYFEEIIIINIKNIENIKNCKKITGVECLNGSPGWISLNLNKTKRIRNSTILNIVNICLKSIIEVIYP